ncbi:unnamed protein product [Phytophthora lilii]|uniref:Unnamed protein product n=1 Tax=Phytophthora lilii TaxID=2077276 RepID=A0A9W6TUD3_9STRA|nr:unnamed protein product [Phytophthora lilii]
MQYKDDNVTVLSVRLGRDSGKGFVSMAASVGLVAPERSIAIKTSVKTQSTYLPSRDSMSVERRSIYVDSIGYGSSESDGDSTDNSYTDTAMTRSQAQFAMASSSTGYTKPTYVATTSTINATNTIKSTYVNWVGTALDTSSTTACYREAHVANACPMEFDSSGTCWHDARTRIRSNMWHEFLDVALQHCAAGARISGYLARDVGLQRTGCEISITQVDVDAPEHCNYFPHTSALVPVITVVDPIAAGKGSAGVLPLQPLSFASKKFQRAFERTKQSEPARFARFPRERENISVIRDFLLAHEMDALTYEPSEGLQDGDEKSDVMNEDVNAADGSKQFAYPLEDGMKHYNDAQSRREYLSTLRRKAAASKQMLG